VEIECSVMEDQIWCCVKDTGIGVPADKTEAIFNRFEQADLVNRHAYEGSGLGLTIAKAYVEMLGGKIWLESTSGEGSAFHFTIALHQKPKSTGVVHEAVLPAPFIAGPTKPLKIMVVEDDLASFQYLSMLLKEDHMNILYCKNGIEAVEQCRLHPDVDIILMDIKMPEMDGFEATRLIREFNQQVIIIAQTAYALGGDRARALAVGCNEHIYKPINADTLLRMINQLSDNKV
jgi:CheY-like chemotaxis protein